MLRARVHAFFFGPPDHWRSFGARGAYDVANLIALTAGQLVAQTSRTGAQPIHSCNTTASKTPRLARSKVLKNLFVTLQGLAFLNQTHELHSKNLLLYFHFHTINKYG